MDDLLIIGAGWAGLSAAAFATKLYPNAKIRLIGQGIGSPIVTPGWISVAESAEGDLFSALQAITAQAPEHPYALVGRESLESALRLFCDITAEIGLPYHYNGSPLQKIRTLTALGAAQHPTLVPTGYLGAQQAGESPLFVGFTGWRDYYPQLSGKHHAYVALTTGQRHWDLTPTDYARLFDRADFRAEVIQQVKPHLPGATSAAFPAVLGLEQPDQVMKELESAFGVPVFELPTLPPSVPGTRLFNHMRRYLLDNRVRVQIGHPVQRGILENNRCVGVEVAAAGHPQLFKAHAVILATGNLYGGGLFSDDRGKVWEGIFNLPVQYITDRDRWFGETMLDSAGHAAHHFGIRVNEYMQPLNADGTVFAEGLYAAGQLLATPIASLSPLESAEGVALATAYKAIERALG